MHGRDERDKDVNLEKKVSHVKLQLNPFIWLGKIDIRLGVRLSGHGKIPNLGRYSALTRN